MNGHLINGIGITGYLCGKNMKLYFHFVRHTKYFKMKGVNENVR